MLTEEQVKEIKSQILKQIESWQVDDVQKTNARQQVEAMSSTDLEAFLAKNNIVKKGKKKKGTDCPFCMIVKGEIPCFKIAEDSDSIAVLEINPLSRGHTIIIPKKHDSEVSSESGFVKNISEKIKKRLSAEEIKFEKGDVLGHKALNLIPIYKDSKLERKKADEAELAKIKEELSKSFLSEKETKQSPNEEKEIKEEKKEEKKLEKAPRRIP